MTERLYLEAPSPEQVLATYKGMTFDEFKLLDDETVDEMMEQERIEWAIACRTLPGFHSEQGDGEWQAAREKIDTLSRFIEWRKYGIPDRDMTYDEINDRIWHQFAKQRAENPSFGDLSESDFDDFSHNEFELLKSILVEFDRECNWQEQPIVRPGLLENEIKDLGVDYEDMVKKSVLAPLETDRSIMWKSGRKYVLVGKYAAFIAMRPFAFSDKYKID